MKPEPLKDQKNPVVEGQSYSYLFRKEDIKSAVEWLKKQFKRNKSGTDNPFCNTYIEKKINKAFEDVVNQKQGE